MKTRSLLLVLFGITLAFSAQAQTMEEAISTLSDELGEALAAKGALRVAPIDFVDLQGRPTLIGRQLAEDISVNLVINATGVSVVDRANIKSILAEHKLTEEGLVDPKNAQKLGQFAGVDTILTGIVSPMDDQVMLTVKAISTETAEVIAAGRASFDKTQDIQLLLNRATPAQSIGTEDSSGIGYVAADTIATKDLGPLRVSLLAVSPAKSKISNRGGVKFTAISCSFELTNLDLNNLLYVAHSGQLMTWGNNFYSRRGSLYDANGETWQLVNTTGLPLVACGKDDDPSQMVKIIQTGKHVSDMFTSRPDHGWSGDFLTLEPGQSARITTLFSFQARNGDYPDRGVDKLAPFRLNMELISGVSPSGNGDIAYSLQNLVFDEIGVPEIELE